MCLLLSILSENAWQMDNGNKTFYLFYFEKLWFYKKYSDDINIYIAITLFRIAENKLVKRTNVN